jgi:hypothetical protein
MQSMDDCVQIFHSSDWSDQIIFTKLRENTLLAEAKNSNALPLVSSVTYFTL